MNALDVFSRAVARPFRGTQASGFGFDDWAQLFSLDSPFFGHSANLRADVESPDPSFTGMATGVYGRSPIAFAALNARAKLFSQARFQFQQMFGGREGKLFGTQALAPLEHPEPGEGTVDLLYRAILDADLAGDWFGARRALRGEVRIKRLRPDWTTVVLGSRNPDVSPDAIGLDPDAEIVGFGFEPGGPSSGLPIVAFGREEVAHFHPNLHPLNRYRGMPLLGSALREVLGDSAATSHKLAFFRNAAIPGMVVTIPATMDEAKAKAWIKLFEQKNVGSLKAYKTLFFGAGWTAQPLGHTFEQQTFKELQGAAETRIAAMTGIHPVVIGFSEGLQGSSLNAGNFAAAARSSADVTLRWLWQNFCGSMEVIIPPPGGTRLWYDERSIPFLQADVKDRAEVRKTDAEAASALVAAGYEPDSVRDAIIADDFTLLVHTGLPSVQLQQGTPAAAATPAPAQQATGAFWPSDSSLVALGPVHAGTEFPSGHPLVRAYPSMFRAAGTAPQLKAGPAPLVGRPEILARQAALRAAGMPSGYDSLAREFSVSRDTIRRRLTE